jgi:hypothetical protein
MCDSFESTSTKMQNDQVFHSCSSLQGEQQNLETVMVSSSIVKHGIFEHRKIHARHGETQVEIDINILKPCGQGMKEGSKRGSLYGYLQVCPM